VQPDVYFIIGGAVAVGFAAVLFVRACRGSGRPSWTPALLWACLGAGLVLQGWAPHLPVERSRFILSSERVNNIAGLVERERRMQLLSALLTGAAALGLAFTHRDLWSGCDSSTRAG
jgi:hypothetical protein